MNEVLLKNVYGQERIHFLRTLFGFLSLLTLFFLGLHSILSFGPELFPFPEFREFLTSQSQEKLFFFAFLTSSLFPSHIVLILFLVLSKSMGALPFETYFTLICGLFTRVPFYFFLRANLYFSRKEEIHSEMELFLLTVTSKILTLFLVILCEKLFSPLQNLVTVLSEIPTFRGPLVDGNSFQVGALSPIENFFLGTTIFAGSFMIGNHLYLNFIVQNFSSHFYRKRFKQKWRALTIGFLTSALGATPSRIISIVTPLKVSGIFGLEVISPFLVGIQVGGVILPFFIMLAIDTPLAFKIYLTYLFLVALDLSIQVPFKELILLLSQSLTKKLGLHLIKSRFLLYFVTFLFIFFLFKMEGVSP